MFVLYIIKIDFPKPIETCLLTIKLLGKQYIWKEYTGFNFSDRCEMNLRLKANQVSAWLLLKYCQV